MQSLLAVRGGNVQRDIHDEFVDSGDNPSEWYDHTELALRRVIEFLKEQGVPHLLLMPNTLPIPVLAAFFHVHPDPSPWIRRLLARWLWRGWIHGFGTESGQTPIMRRAISTINPKKLEPERVPEAHLAIEKLLEHVSEAPAPVIKVSPIRTDKAVGRIVLLALASLHPMKQDGEVLDLAAAFDADGPKAVTDLVRGHRTKAAARGFWPRGDRRPNGHEDEKVLRSHAISVTAAEALSSGNIERFLDIREDEISRLVQGYVIGRVDAGGSVRPSISDLIVLDPDDDLERT